MFVVISGVLVFVAGQIIQLFFLKPIQELHGLIGEIAFCLHFYANVGPMKMAPVCNSMYVAGSTSKELRAGRTRLRRLASRVHRSVRVIPFYCVFERIHVVPKRASVLQAAQHLTGWSNALSDDDGSKGHYREKIRELLGIVGE